jgi:hypothetical protein
MDSASGVVSVGKPEGWDAIVAFADGPRTTFEEIRKNRPPREVIKRALDGYLENIKVENCKVNEGYLKALGLK